MTVSSEPATAARHEAPRPGWERARAAWNRYWFEPQAPEALGVFRILLGVFFLVFWLLPLPHVQDHYGAMGIHAPMFGAPPGGLAAVRDITDLLGVMTQPVAPWVTWTLYLTLIASVTAFTVGYATRLAGTVHVALYLYFYLLANYQLGASYNRLFLQVAALMVLARSDAAFSVAAWRRRRRGEAPVEAIDAWPVRLICLQMMAVYVGTGWTKVMSEAWQGGEVLYYALIGGWASPLSFWLVRIGPGMWVYDLAVAGTIVFELLAPVGLYVRRWQPSYFAAGFLFHLGIALTLQIWQFLAMPAAYVLFLDPTDVRDWCRRRYLLVDAPGTSE